MIKYFKELENKKEFYLPLIIDKIIRKEKEYIKKAYVPIEFIVKYSDLFEQGDVLLKIYDNFNIDKWYKSNLFTDKDIDDIYLFFESIGDEDYNYIIEEINSYQVNSHNIYNYLDLLKKITNLFQELLPHNKEYYSIVEKRIINACKELNKYTSIEYSKIETGEYYIEPDSWYITPNNYLYNPGDGSHQARAISEEYREIKEYIKSGKKFSNHSTSNAYINKTKEMGKRGYITKGQFYNYLHYINYPMFLEEINNEPITRERHIFTIIIGIVNSKVGIYKFFEDLCLKTDNPKEELEKIIKWTNNDIGDILVRCCGFHKVESTVDKTITTSLINYEEEFKEYIDKGWNIVFIPPIIIDEYDNTIKEYPEEFLKIRKILKK